MKSVDAYQRCHALSANLFPPDIEVEDSWYVPQGVADAAVRDLCLELGAAKRIIRLLRGCTDADPCKKECLMDACPFRLAHQTWVLR